MSLPLLALRAQEVSAPFPKNRITIVLNFDPLTTRRYGGLSFKGPSVLMWISPSMSSMPTTTRLVAERLAEWVSAGLVDKAGAGSPLPDGGRSWSVTWKDFSSSVALTTRRSVNSPGGAASVPYTLVDFRQTLLYDGGKQMAKFEFALESESKLLEWIGSP
jgi:hypothetical protein